MKATLNFGIAISMVLYAISLVIPALTLNTPIPGQSESLIGVNVLLMGWLAVSKGSLAWLANVTMILSWLTAALKRPITCSILSGCTFLLTIDVIRFNVSGVPDKAGCCLAIKELESGFYIWSFSAIVMFFLALAAIALRPSVSNLSLHTDPQAGQ